MTKEKMIEINVPGMERPYRITSLVLDYNGTVACDGRLLPAAAERIKMLTKLIPVYILTADTYGTVRQQCEGLGAEIKTFAHAGAAVCKEEIVRSLGKGVCAVGNGLNDIQMMDAADLAICVIEKEGACAKLLVHADVVVTAPEDALDLLINTDRLRATLRN